MLAAFELVGFRLDAPIVARPGPTRAAPQLSLKASLALFRQLVLYVSQNCLCEADGLLFTASYAPGHRLARFRAVQSIPCIKALPVCSAGFTRSLTHCVLTCLGKHIPAKKLQLLVLGVLTVKPQILSYRGPPL